MELQLTIPNMPSVQLEIVKPNKEYDLLMEVPPQLTMEVSLGKNGIDGKSAYDVAVANGFDGTEAEWLDSLKTESNIDFSLLYNISKL